MTVQEIPGITINRGTWSKYHLTRTTILEKHNKDTSYQHNSGVTYLNVYLVKGYAIWRACN